MIDLDKGLLNPYWAEVEKEVRESKWPYGPGLAVGEPNFKAKDAESMFGLDRYLYVPRYAWTITDPESVEFVAEHAEGGIVDPMAGTGYWAFVLSQLGVDVVCYDLGPGENEYHMDHDRFFRIGEMDCADAAAKHPDRTLLLSWPPFGGDQGSRALKAYQGNRVIYMGEGSGGCTGDEAMFTILDQEWESIDYRRPVQWWGVHDYITVYARR